MAPILMLDFVENGENSRVTLAVRDLMRTRRHGSGTSHSVQKWRKE